VFIFNIFDTVGRFVGNIEAFELKLRTTKTISYLRVIFVATFLFTDFQVVPRVIWDTDWFKLINLSLLAFTTGYIGTLCAVKVPATVELHRRAEVGAYIGTCMCLGILIGAFLQIFMTPIIALTPKQQ
jgi:hypothetical protein